ncbi:general substrate transporter [Plenodomus tracheiphilus IPT5]|uniref:General substrate transporter n=1 Tax=Plenodomus tracheiphilus IPT5 TaxID=1408161 RepID=A0A6A7B4Y6_9PLEO|nr:general substrate transporter [Plenodomus tracheiphilus IPT5]
MADSLNNTHPQWWRDPGIRRLNFLLLSCYLGAMANGYISSLISNLIANPRWLKDIDGLSKVHLGLVTAAQSLGCIAAFFPAPWLSDKYGRRAGIISGNFGMIAGFTGQIFCISFGQFIATRIVIGFASIFNTISSSALLIELAHPRQRAVAGALFNTFAIQLFWSLAQLSMIMFCPESPRWLVRNGKQEQARDVLTKYHANGHEGDQLVFSEFSSICALAERELQDRNSNWSNLYTTPGNRKRLILTITVGITSASRQQGINGGLQIYNWCLASVAALLSERAGRRRMFLTSAFTMLVFMVMITICSAVYSARRSIAAGYAVIVFLFLFLGGYVIGLTPIPILYVNEIWPSHLRTKGTSVFWVTQAIAICFNQFVNPMALNSIAWRYYLFYVAVLVFVIGFMFFYVPETKGLSLEEVSSIFDGDDHDVIELPVVLGGRIAEEQRTIRGD